MLLSLTPFSLCFTRRSADVISSTLSTIFQEYFKSNGNERSVFWDEEYMMNLDPFQGENANFWGADWDFKVRTHIPLFSQCPYPRMRRVFLAQGAASTR